MDAKTIEQIIDEFIRWSAENSLKNEDHEPAWEEALIGFSSGADPIYQSYKVFTPPSDGSGHAFQERMSIACLENMLKKPLSILGIEVT